MLKIAWNGRGGGRAPPTARILRKEFHFLLFEMSNRALKFTKGWRKTFETGVGKNCTKVLPPPTPPPPKKKQKLPCPVGGSRYCVKGYLACDNQGGTPNEVTAVIPGKGYFKIGGGGGEE